MDDAGEMVRRYAGVVWGTVYRLVGSGGRGGDGEARDCFQEVVVAALEVGRRGARSGESGVRNWEAMLRRLATVKGLDVLRRRVRERERRGVMEGEVMTREAGPEELAERAELVGRMREALGELPGEQAEVFCLRHVSGMSYEEIGAVMGMTGNAVGVVLTRAKGKLRELMESSEVRHDG